MLDLTVSNCSLNFFTVPSRRPLRGERDTQNCGVCQGHAQKVGYAQHTDDAGEEASCACGGGSGVMAHMSFLINSTRFVTLFFTSTSSCFTSTGPINLKTEDSSSSSSSSCDDATA